MRTLTKTEWIAVVIVLVVAVLVFVPRFFTQKQAQINQDININTDNKMDQNTTSNEAGLVVKDVVVGTGAEAKVGNMVSVNYTGKFADGKIFDSSIPRGKPIEFTLGIGQVIKGWDQGVSGMKVGGKRTLVIPPNLGYGAEGYPGAIPGNATLYFEVELVGVKVQ